MPKRSRILQPRDGWQRRTRAGYRLPARIPETTISNILITEELLGCICQFLICNNKLFHILGLVCKATQPAQLWRYQRLMIHFSFKVGAAQNLHSGMRQLLYYDKVGPSVVHQLEAMNLVHLELNNVSNITLTGLTNLQRLLIRDVGGSGLALPSSLHELTISNRTENSHLDLQHCTILKKLVLRFCPSSVCVWGGREGHTYNLYQINVTPHTKYNYVLQIYHGWYKL